MPSASTLRPTAVGGSWARQLPKRTMPELGITGGAPCFTDGPRDVRPRATADRAVRPPPSGCLPWKCLHSSHRLRLRFCLSSKGPRSVNRPHHASPRLQKRHPPLSTSESPATGAYLQWPTADSPPAAICDLPAECSPVPARCLLASAHHREQHQRGRSRVATARHCSGGSQCILQP